MDPIEIRVLDEGHAVVARFHLTDDGEYLVGRNAGTAEIALPDQSVSRRHCLLRVARGQLCVRNEAARNPSRLGRRRVAADWLDWPPGEALSVGIYTLFRVDPQALPEDANPETDLDGMDLTAPARSPVAVTSGSTPTAPPTAQEPDEVGNTPSVNVAFPASAFAARVVDVAELVASGHGIEEVEIACLGGGPGTFAFVHAARVHGAGAAAIRVIAAVPEPLGALKATLATLGLGGEAVLRSPGWARPDNLWGLPGYGLQAGLSALLRLRPRLALGHFAASLAGDGLVARSAPTLLQVERALEREARRIGWAGMVTRGQALALRQTSDGRYAIAWRMPAEAAEGHARNRFLIARHVHVALGRPAPRHPAALAEFRRSERGNYRALAAFEPHGAMIEALERDGGNVTVIGAGQAAASVLAQLAAARLRNRRVGLVHVVSGAPAPEGHGFKPVAFGFRLQQDRWPVASLVAVSGGTPGMETAPDRMLRDRLLRQAEEQNAYRRHVGDVVGLKAVGECIRVEIERAGGSRITFESDFLIDCTTMPGDPLALPLLRDLKRTYDPALEPGGAGGTTPGTGGFALAGDGSLAALSNGAGRVFVAGFARAGGADIAADHFAGLMRSAHAACGALAGLRAAGLRPLGPVRSLVQWVRWVVGARP